MEVSDQLHAPATLPPGKELLVPIGYEARWAPEPVWTRWWREKFPAPGGTRPPQHPDRNPARILQIRMYRKTMFTYFIWVWNLIYHQGKNIDRECLKIKLLRMKYGPSRQDVNRRMDKLHNEGEFRNFYCTLHTVGVIKSWRNGRVT